MGRSSTNRPASSQLAVLTPNQKLNIIKQERERRRLIRYQQVRQLSAENAAKVRERVRTAKQRELEEIKKRITDAIVQRNNIASPQISPVHNSQPQRTSRRPRRRQLTRAEIERTLRRYREAVEKLHQGNERERRGRAAVLERRRKAWDEANARSRGN